MPYSCTVLCGLLPCVNLVYPVKIFIKVHVTSPASWLLSALRHTHSLTHSLTCSFPQDNLWRRRSSWFWDDRLWRHCSQSGRRRLISVFVVHFVWARANVAWLLILATCEGDSQFPSALYGSVYSELWEADEALSLLILQAQSDGGWWWW